MEALEDVKKRLAKDMSRDEALDFLRNVCDGLIAYYLAIACPCAFPRFRFLAGFLGKKENMDKQPVKLAHALDTNVLIASVIRSGFLDDKSTCKTCGTEYEHEYEQFSISFEETTMYTKQLKAKEVGANIIDPTPLFAGLYYGGEDPKLSVISVTLGDFDSYMREVA